MVVGYAAETSPRGGINRGIGVAIAKHPLGPFTKQVGDALDYCQLPGPFAKW